MCILLSVEALIVASSQCQNFLIYSSEFRTKTEAAQKILVDGRILAQGEKPHEMVERIVRVIADAEDKYALAPIDGLTTKKFASTIGRLFDNGDIVFSTPILTNAGRFDDRPLSACAMPPVNLAEDMHKIKKIVDRYHQDGMGTGYNLSDLDNPVEMLRFLNRVAVEGAASMKEQRPVGNMAILDVDSPHIFDFVKEKVDSDAKGEDWKFNISVNVTDAFMEAAEKNESFELRDGRVVSAKKILQTIAGSAHNCGDPGIISLDRLNKDNPTPLVCQYKTTAPCAEVGLAPGETCVFGYINLASFFMADKCDQVDFERLSFVVSMMVRALDAILEISIQRYSSVESKDIMQKKRKIGVGVCGFADLLLKCNISYGEKKAQDLLQELLSYISYHAKVTSMHLAEARGSFTAIEGSRFMDESFLVDKYARSDSSRITREEWVTLAKQIKDNKMLRHATVTSLPPTGRSAIVIGASQSIEPIFSMKTCDGLHPLLQNYLKKESVPDDIIEEIYRTGSCAKLPGKHPFVTATELSYKEHLAMVIAAQQAIDESISKTINVSNDITSQDIMAIYLDAYNSGLKGISVFRDGSRTYQPKALSKKEKS